MGQWAVSGTIPVFTIPPGPCAVTMYAPTGVVYTGTGASVSTSTGMSVPTAPVTFQCFPGSRGAQIYGTVGTAATTVAIHYVISTGG